MNASLRRTATAVVMVALAAAAVGFAPAPSAPTPSEPAPAAAFDARVIDGELRTTVNGLYDRTGLAPGEDVHDLMSWIRAARRLAEAGGMQTIAATDECAPLDESPDEPVSDECDEEPWDEEYSYSSLEAVGDLNGDGWEDVLEVTVTATQESYTESLTARSGRDGEVLWSNTVEHSDAFGFIATAPDLDGDGGDELLVVEFVEDWSFEGACSPVRCTWGEEFGETIRLTAVAGATGAPLGSVSHEFRVTINEADTTVGMADVWAGQYEGSVELVGALTWLGFVDPGGDGSYRLLRGAVDLQEEWNGVGVVAFGEDSWDSAHGGHEALSVTSSVDLTDLVDGSGTAILVDEPALVFAATATLDGVDAIILDAYELDGERYSGCIESDTLSVFDCGVGGMAAETEGTRTLLGPDLQPVWETPASLDVLAVYGAAGDVTGDGWDDLLEAEIDWDAFAVVTNVIDGTTGATVWSAPVDGGVADDGTLLAVSFTWTEESTEETWAYELTAQAMVLAGTDGSVLATDELAAVEGHDDGSGTLVEGWVAVDLLPLDGTGTDVLTYTEQVTLEEVDRYEECWQEEDPETGAVDEWCWEWIDYEVVELRAELSGHTGGDLAELFRLDLDRDWLLDVVDLDGDGPVELLVASFDEASESVQTVARRQDGSALWTLADEFVTALLAGPDGPSVVSWDWWLGGYVVRDGTTLAELWRTAGGGDIGGVDAQPG